MNEDKVIQVLARVEDERNWFREGKPGAVGFDMATWYRQTTHWTDSGKAVCGTTACLAGHACLMEGWRPDVHDATYVVNEETNEYAEIEALGAEILGISEVEAGWLFYLDCLDDVYIWIAERMGLDEQVLRDKVQASRGS